MTPLQVEAEVSKRVLKLIYIPQKSPINSNIKLMKSLNAERGGRGVYLPLQWGVGDTLETYCDNEGIDRVETSDNSHSSEINHRSLSSLEQIANVSFKSVKQKK